MQYNIIGIKYYVRHIFFVVKLKAAIRITHGKWCQHSFSEQTAVASC